MYTWTCIPSFFFKYVYAPRNIWDTKENAVYLKFKFSCILNFISQPYPNLCLP